MEYSTPFRPFSTGFFSDFERTKFDEIEEEIEGLSERQLLGVDSEELLNYFVGRYSINSPELHYEHAELSSKE